MPLKTALVENTFVAKQFCLAGDGWIPLAKQRHGQERAGHRFKENAACAGWSRVFPGFTDTKGQKMGSELCSLSSQPYVLWDHQHYSSALPPLWPSPLMS